MTETQFKNNLSKTERILLEEERKGGILKSSVVIAPSVMTGFKGSQRDIRDLSSLVS